MARWMHHIIRKYWRKNLYSSVQELHMGHIWTLHHDPKHSTKWTFSGCSRTMFRFQRGHQNLWTLNITDPLSGDLKQAAHAGYQRIYKTWRVFCFVFYHEDWAALWQENINSLIHNYYKTLQAFIAKGANTIILTAKGVQTF